MKIKLSESSSYSSQIFDQEYAIDYEKKTKTITSKYYLIINNLNLLKISNFYRIRNEQWVFRKLYYFNLYPLLYKLKLQLNHKNIVHFNIILSAS